MTDHYPPMKRCSDCDQPFEEDTGNHLCPDCNRRYDRMGGAMTDTAAATHTPGPWQVKRVGEEVSISDAGGFLSHAHVFGDSPEQTDANAHLIARAPELLAENERLTALNAAMLAALEVFFDMSGCDCDSAYRGEEWVAPEHAADCPVYQRYIAQEAAARATIAQARGGEKVQG